MINSNDLLKQIKGNKGVVVADNSGAGYQDVVVSITDVRVDYPKNLKSDSPLIAKADDNQLYVVFDLSVSVDGKTLQREEASGFQTKAGGIAYYGPSTKSDGSKNYGSLLYSFVQAVKDYSEKQKNTIGEELNFTESLLKGMKFNYKGKVVKFDGIETVLLETPYQQFKDAEYAANRAVNEASTETSTEPKGSALP